MAKNNYMDEESIYEITISIRTTSARAERTRRCLIQLVKEEVFELKNGKAILHFDKEGDIREVEIRRIAWRT